jgi:hypothetical protein
MSVNIHTSKLTLGSNGLIISTPSLEELYKGLMSYIKLRILGFTKKSPRRILRSSI